MKYYLGAVCVLMGAWLVYQALAHRRAVIGARERAAARNQEPKMHRHLDGMRLALAPLYVMSILLTGIVLAGIWFVVDRERVFSVLDILGFLLALGAYAFWMSMRIQYSPIGLESKQTE
ncbi:hypothetical protein [Thiocapsa marina]|uniref:Uncharacterized protein n=1 Tax=Thiocapsa marina 5811 TaxID=768671 RepID=F9UFD4_9GAMM|nr:hypothetical protein [Thiocapsa marina]EGV17171.1 hypothetical protein ThimaDRAFT_3637 [Thiocapsa marina 5811]